MRFRFGALLAGLAALTLLNALGSMWRYSQAIPFEQSRWPAAGSPRAAIVFYSSMSEDARRRLDHALILRKQGAVGEILIVGGYRGGRGYNGAAELAARAKLYISDPEAVAHDAGSYDTLSNLEAICNLRAAAAPNRSLVLISDPLHMARIWPQRWRIDCVDDSLLGYDTVAVAGGPVWKWYLASRDCLADAARLLLGERFYRSAIQQWRWLQDS
jgi:hypothetical protein